MTDKTSAKVWENVPSPFCGIASDDLRIEVCGSSVRVLANGDAVTVPGFERPVTDTAPRIAGEPASLEDAVRRAAEILKEARLPVFSGFGTDVNDTRAALALIDKVRGIFDQARAAGGVRNLLALADSGWIATTLAEVKNRVEVLLVFGSDVEAAFPRFFERFVWNRETLFGQDPARREVICVGRAPSGDAAVSPDGRRPQVVECDPRHLPELAAALSALARGASLQAETVGGIPVVVLRGIVERLRRSSYSVVTWVAGQLDFAHADLTVQQVCQMVALLNKETRAAVLPLGGQDGDRTASQVCAWLTGYPTRVSFARGFPEYDPYLNDASRLLKDGEADALVWVSSLSPAPPPAAEVPTVVIGRSGMQFDEEPEVYIPVGVPGIDHAGHMYRCDNVVAMPLYALRDCGLTTAAAVLAAIEQSL
ncbi:formylmethanofuran dehydrogenase subunit B [Methylococcus capsulatus]|jgi:formylmethanofuran dehydrogenase subunit B|uniref:Formylmethanofuran dehydrogenase subunit B n=1 Tax=Methylococcus capsulatus TaxID=414 RepID=A0AA35Y074_METCP|nr:formylmethanofuran dehydrogenase subunit B [Methylococcus capsulatus]CAI8807357.1 formylmethanofuran dehydrogenase subunit B [Methylococcus capsulatus]